MEPSGRMHNTLSISCSPLVIILKIAFLSAQIPNVEQVSIQTPVYIFPDFDSTAAETSPQVTYSDILRSFNTAFAAPYISVHIFSIDTHLIKFKILLTLSHFTTNHPMTQEQARQFLLPCLKILYAVLISNKHAIKRTISKFVILSEAMPSRRIYALSIIPCRYSVRRSFDSLRSLRMTVGTAPLFRTAGTGRTGRRPASGIRRYPPGSQGSPGPGRPFPRPDSPWAR